jgi:hypothetical protein
MMPKSAAADGSGREADSREIAEFAQALYRAPMDGPQRVEQACGLVRSSAIGCWSAVPSSQQVFVRRWC